MSTEIESLESQCDALAEKIRKLDQRLDEVERKAKTDLYYEVSKLEGDIRDLERKVEK